MFFGHVTLSVSSSLQFFIRNLFTEFVPQLLHLLMDVSVRLPLPFIQSFCSLTPLYCCFCTTPIERIAVGALYPQITGPGRAEAPPTLNVQARKMQMLRTWNRTENAGWSDGARALRTHNPLLLHHNHGNRKKVADRAEGGVSRQIKDEIYRLKSVFGLIGTTDGGQHAQVGARVRSLTNNYTNARD